MEPPVNAEDIPLPLRGKTIARCIVDDAFGIDFIEEGRRSTIRIEGRFRFRDRIEELSISPGKIEDMGRALVLIGKTVTKAVARGIGALEVTFDDGTELSVPPNPSIEAWEFAGPDKSIVVSLAGGGLSTWAKVERMKARGKP